MAEGNSEGLKKTRHGDGDGASLDRLSDLPEPILHHILSFLDTKSLYRTSRLSRMWECMWKQVGVLNFSCVHFKTMSSFEKHALKLLSLRSDDEDDSAAVSSVTFRAWRWTGEGLESNYINLFDKVMKHAAAAASNRSLHHLSMDHPSARWFKCEDVVASIKAHRHHQSLKTLELKSWSLESGGGRLFSGFNLLTNLELHNCSLLCPVSSSLEPFLDLPCLKHLKLVDCYPYPSCLLKVYGPELLDLRIQNSVYSSQKVEVFAPKLKSFCFWGCLEKIIQLNLPSLDHANIRVRIKQQQEIEATDRACLKLLPQLHNVESLNLRFDKASKSQGRWGQHEFPLMSSTELFPELEISPFTRLENLRVWYPYKPPKESYQLIRYFFEGSPRTTRKSYVFQKKPE